MKENESTSLRCTNLEILSFPEGTMKFYIFLSKNHGKKKKKGNRITNHIIKREFQLTEK